MECTSHASIRSLNTDSRWLSSGYIADPFLHPAPALNTTSQPCRKVRGIDLPAKLTHYLALQTSGQPSPTCYSDNGLLPSGHSSAMSWISASRARKHCRFSGARLGCAGWVFFLGLCRKRLDWLPFTVPLGLGVWDSAYLPRYFWSSSRLLLVCLFLYAHSYNALGTVNPGWTAAFE